MSPWYVCDAACPVDPTRRLTPEERLFWAHPGVDDPSCPRCGGCCNPRLDELPARDRGARLAHIGALPPP